MKTCQHENRSSGIRLMQLIDTSLFQILRKERNNGMRICLYGTGEFWVAFEQSAYLLCQLFSSSDTFIVTHPEYPFPVVIACITDEELRAYGRTHIYCSNKLDYKELLTSEMSDKLYRLWHQREVQELG